MGTAFNLPASVTDVIVQSGDEYTISRSLYIMFKMACMGVVTEVNGERPLVRLTVGLAVKEWQRWQRRAAQYRESKRRLVEFHNDSTKEKERKEERKPKEEISPTPPYKEKDKRENKSKEQETREDVEFHNQSTTDVDAEFSSFWNRYPRKVARKAALNAWHTLFRNTPKSQARALLASISSGLSAAMRSEQWQRDDGKYIPHAATWIHQERWNDEQASGSCRAQDESRLDRADRLARMLSAS